MVDLGRTFTDIWFLGFVIATLGIIAGNLDEFINFIQTLLAGLFLLFLCFFGWPLILIAWFKGYL